MTDSDALNDNAAQTAGKAFEVRSVSPGALAAARKVITKLRTRANMHSVWVQTDVVDGEFRDRIAVAVSPDEKTGADRRVPATMDGYEIVQVPWHGEHVA